MPLTTSQDVHERFFLLTGLIRHEFWLNGQKPEDYRFVADPDNLTLRALKQNNAGAVCELQVSEELLRGDLHALAREFFGRVCHGRGKKLL